MLVKLCLSCFQLFILFEFHGFRCDISDSDNGLVHSDFDGREGTVVGQTVFHGRAFDNGTITNKLEGTVTIQGAKLWRNIADGLQNYNYPIADVFLYANIKSHSAGYTTADTSYACKDGVPYSFEEGGYALVEGAEYPENALGELVNYLQIKGGQQEFGFSQQKTIRKNGFDVAYQSGTDYVLFDEAQTVALEKYDENGALIQYHLRERAINGYDFRINNDTIINEYNGGDRVQLSVEKDWKNMDANSVYPTVVFTLHQCYVGKTDNAEDAPLSVIEYQTFSRTFRDSDWDKTTNHIDCTFGEDGSKETLYRYSPTGQEFFYYITEELKGVGKPTDTTAVTGDILFSQTYAVDPVSRQPIKVSGDTFDLVNGKKIGANASGLFAVPTDGIRGDRVTVRISHLPEKWTAPNGKKFNYIYTVVETDQNGQSLEHSDISCMIQGTGSLDLIISAPLGQTPPDAVYFRVMRKPNATAAQAEGTVPGAAAVTGLQAMLPVVSDELTGLGFRAEIEEPKDQCFPADRKTCIFMIPSEYAGEASYTIVGLAKQEKRNVNHTDVFYDYHYRVAACEAEGTEIGNLTFTSSEESDGTVTLTVSPPSGGAGPLYFRLFRYYTVQDTPSAETAVNLRADGKTLWAAIPGEASGSAPLHKEAGVKNTYQPDEDAYKSKLTIHKSWDSYQLNNPLNKEFDGIANYCFKLKRYAARIGEEAVFMIDTGTDGMPSVHIDPGFMDSVFAIDTSDSFRPAGRVTVTRTNTQTEESFLLQRRTMTGQEYENVSDTVFRFAEGAASVEINDVMLEDSDHHEYSFRAAAPDVPHTALSGASVSKESLYDISTLILTKTDIYTHTEEIPVVIRVFRADKRVEIEGLAIYSQNGLLYTYVVDEISMDAFHRRNDRPVECRIEPITNSSHKIIGGNAVFSLENQLKYFHLRLNKVFGAEFIGGDNIKHYESIDPENYPLYFNEAFLNALRFRVQRKRVDETTWSDYLSLDVNQNASAPSIHDNQNGTASVTARLERYPSGSSRAGQYYYTFENLPTESADGTVYQYRVIEENTSVGDHVSIYYPSDNSENPASGSSAMTSDTDTADLRFRIERSADNGSYTVMTNGVTASVGTDSFVPDENNGFFAIPQTYKTNGIYLVTIGSLPANGTENGEDVSYRYRITDVSGSSNPAVRMSEESFTLKRSTAVYSSQSFSPFGSLFTISNDFAIDQVISVRIPQLPVAIDGVNYTYRAADQNGNPLESAVITHYSDGGEQKDLVVSVNVGSGDLKFSLQRYPEYFTVTGLTASAGSQEGITQSGDTFTVPAAAARNGTMTVTVDGLNESEEYSVEVLSGDWGNVTLSEYTEANTRRHVVTADFIGEGSTADFSFRIRRADFGDVENITALLYFDTTIPHVYSPENGLYTISHLEQTEGVYCFKLEGVDPGVYRIVNASGNEIPASLSSSLKSSGKMDIAVRVRSVSEEELVFRIQKKNGENSFEDYSGPVKVGQYEESIVTKDRNGASLRMEYFLLNAQTAPVLYDSYGNPIGYGDNQKQKTVTGHTVTVPADYAFEGKFSVLAEGLPKTFRIPMCRFNMRSAMAYAPSEIPVRIPLICW